MLAVCLVSLLGVASVAQRSSAAWTNAAYSRSAAAADFFWYGQLRLYAGGTNPGLCLDVPARVTTAGTALQLYACNKTPAQIWTFLPDGSIQVYKSVGRMNETDNSPMCLQSNGSGNNVTIQSCTGAKSQVWARSTVTGGERIANQDGCLDVSNWGPQQGTMVQSTSCTARNRDRVWVRELVPLDQIYYPG